MSRFLPEDGDRIQSLKHFALNKKKGRWIMSRNTIILSPPFLDTILVSVPSYLTTNELG
jgi:hypothetical protein